MLSRAPILICIGCAVLCGFVGFLSHRSIEQAEKISSEAIEISCGSMIDDPPRESQGVVVYDYAHLEDRLATADFDGDGVWEELAVPLFAKRPRPSKAAYWSVIVWCKGVPDQEALNELLDAGKLRADYWVGQQRLDRDLRSQLAAHYTNMDFENSPVVLVGFDQKNPLLGETSLRLSYMIGTGALILGGAFFLTTVLIGLIKKLPFLQKKETGRPRRKPKANRAGLPSAPVEQESTGGVLDRVRSMRDKQPTS